ncbi:MAG: recombinase family protein [Minisyncoccia bacterium]
MAVLNALAEFGFPIREPHQPHGNPSQPRFGQRLRKNVLVEYKVEQKVIWVIIELREQGFSLRKIAKVLNGMRVASKCDGRWHPEIVRRIIENFESTDS